MEPDVHTAHLPPSQVLADNHKIYRRATPRTSSRQAKSSESALPRSYSSRHKAFTRLQGS
jgi:hypothetical protein